MLDRRTFLGTSLAASLVGIGEAEAATSLGQYVVLPGDGTSSARSVTNGFRLRGGAFDDPASGVRLFSRFTLPASGTVRYRLTRKSIPSTVTSEGVWFNVGIVWGRDPAALPADTPTDDVDTAKMWNGWRITHANKAANESASNRIRLVTYPDRDRLAPREAKALANFQQGVANTVVLTWRGNVVSLAVPTLGVKARQSWSNAALRVPARGARLMFYASPGGDFLVKNVRLPA
jgi:hypothetical protein